jgi:hypothetical protein
LTAIPSDRDGERKVLLVEKVIFEIAFVSLFPSINWNPGTWLALENSTA